MGNEVKRLLNEEWRSAGEYKISWDGKSEEGNLAASGIYFYRLKADEFTEVKKMVLIK